VAAGQEDVAPDVREKERAFGKQQAEEQGGVARPGSPR